MGGRDFWSASQTRRGDAKVRADPELDLGNIDDRCSPPSKGWNATATGVDPVELRLRNDTDTDPYSGRPFSTRTLGSASCQYPMPRDFGPH